MDFQGNGRPDDVRGFVHKKIWGGITGAVGGLISGGSPISGAISGFVGGGRGGQRTQPAAIPCPAGFTVDTFGQCVPARLQITPPVGLPDFGIPSIPGLVGDLFGFGDQNGREPVPGIVGAGQRLIPGGRSGFLHDAVLGQYGAGLEPFIRESATRVCPKGTVLGNDGVCYVKGSINNKFREWPAGRKPLLTGGEMRAISIASSAGKKMDRTVKRLRGLGMMKSPRHLHKAPPKITVRESGPGGVQLVT